ncbi:hypothetical protein SHIRM173S_02221 [Streptomyces hirsutus]
MSRPVKAPHFVTVSPSKAQPAGRHAAVPVGSLFRRVYVPRACDALAYSMATYAMPLLVLATTGSASLTGLAFALEWIPRVAVFGFAGTLVDRSGAAIVCFLASLARALLVAGGGVALVLLPPGTGETVTVMALAAVTGALTQFSFIANEAVGATVSRRTDGQAHKVQSVLIGIDQTATLVGPALGGVLLLNGPTGMLACLSVLSFLSAALALQTPPTPPARHAPRRAGAGRRPAGRMEDPALPAVSAPAGDRTGLLQPHARAAAIGHPHPRGGPLRPVPGRRRRALVHRRGRHLGRGRLLPGRPGPARPVELLLTVADRRRRY